MNKKMRHANKALEEAMSYCQTFQKREGNTHKSIHAIKECAATPNSPKFHRFDIVKMDKGNFRVEADGKIIEKRFKSKTQAEEWCVRHKC